MRKKKSRPVDLAAPPTAAVRKTSPGASGDGTLIVVELGAEWPAPLANGALVRRVLAQLDGETPAAFAERLASSLDGLFGRGVTLGMVAFSCNERVDAGAEAARRKALGIALGAMAANKSGKAYLTAPLRSSGRLRHALSALARGLHDEWRTAGLEVTVDFADERPAAPEATPFAFTARVA